MKKVKLSDVCSIIVPMRDKPKEFVSNNNAIPWCRIEDIEGKFLNGSKSHKYVSRECISKMNLRVFPIGTVLCAVTGASIGTYAITTKELITNQTFAGLVCGEQLYNEYLYYFIKLYTNVFINNSVGCAQAYITRETLENLMIPLLPYEKQVQLVEILKFLDDKINNNNKINAELESMAKTIYDYWFLQFEFPNKEGKPYKSSGGKMVWNEELKREIPEGWIVCTLSDIIDISSERINSTEIGDRVYVPIEVIPRNKMSFYETADIEKATTGLCPFKAKSILLSNRRVYFHKVSISPYDGVTRDTVIIINPKSSNNLGYVFQLVNSDHFIDYATLNSYGSEQPVLSPLSVMKYKIAYPQNGLDKKYSEYVNDIIDKVLLNQQENKELSSLRDFLLPLLMNGQVGFKEEALADNE